MAQDLFLETERLYFRRFTHKDAPLLVKLDSDPEVMQYISRGVPTSLEKIETIVLPRWLTYYEKHTHIGYWAVHEQHSDAFIGWFHFRPDRFVPTETELGYRLRRTAWGRGFATEGGRALVENGFAQWAVDKVSARTLVGNRASQRVMEKCGLRYEEAFHYPENVLQGWTLEERRAIKYSLTRQAFLNDIH